MRGQIDPPPPLPPTPAVLRLIWNPYLLFNSDIVNFVWKTDLVGRGGGDRKNCCVNFCSLVVLKSSVDEGWWGEAESLISGQLKSHTFPDGYFYVLFLWAIAASDFHPLEIYKNLGFPLSTITFAVNSHGDNHFYKYIYLFQILYNMKSVFFMKIHVKVLTKFKFDLNVKHRSYFL